MLRRSRVYRAGLATAVATARPVVTRALSDPELHDAVKQALSTGRKVTVAVQGRTPRDAARELSGDRRLQREIQSSADRLQSAVDRVLDPPRRRRRRGSLTACLVATAAAIAIAPFVLRKLRGDLA